MRVGAGDRGTLVRTRAMVSNAAAAGRCGPGLVTLHSGGFSLHGLGARVRRADGAKAWAEVLSGLARVAVTVEWERPAWRVRSRVGGPVPSPY